MPDTSSASTASAAETRAAGSRILGFILGGGGAIVDKLFDVANFLTRTAGGYFQAAATDFANLPTAGTVDDATGLFVANNDPNYGLNIGISGTGGSWLQGQRSDGGGSLYSISLNPLGGGVLIGLSGVPNYANDAAAAGGGVPVGGLYRNGSVLMIRAA